MKFKKCVFLLLVSGMVIACKNKNPEANPEPERKNIEKSKIETNFQAIDKTEFINDLQGIWKETAYPFRKAEFKDSEVKFTEEGITEKPQFKTFEISQECSFENNNIRDVSLYELIIRIPEDERCEKIKISNDSLILSGYNVASENDYHIVYMK